MSKALPIRELYKFNPEELRDGLHTDLNILFEDNIIVSLTYKEIILTRFIMEIYHTIPDIKIVSKHCITKYYTNGFLTSKTINRVLENIVEDVVNVYCKVKNDRSILNDLYFHMQQLYNYIYNKLTYHKQNYCNSIHINDLLEIQIEPELLNAIKEVDKKKDVQSVNKTYEILDKIIRTNEKYKDNIISRGYISGSINPNQVKQLLASRGYITEINSAIFKFPVAASFTIGMSNIYDLAIESRSGAKALEMSHKAIQDSEYFAREMQLITMIVEHLVDGDCGSKNYLDWYVRPKTETSKSDLNNIIGKYYLNEETNKEEMITPEHTFLEGKTIKLRSALNCILPQKNAICSRCFGELSYSIPRHFNLGHYCTTVMTQKLSQSILSTKHLTSSASSGVIVLDEVASQIFNVKTNCYYFKPKILNPGQHWEVIIEQHEAFGLKDLRNNVVIENLNPSRVSRITNIILRSTNLKTGEIKDYPIIIRDGNKYGNFTYDFIKHIKDTGVTLDKSDRYVIDLDNFNHKLPFIMMPELEYNFQALVKNIKNKFRKIEQVKGLCSKETPESFIQSLFDVVNSKLDINIALLEVMVYAFTVASIKNRDFSLSRNSDDRQLLKSGELVVLRSLGVGYGWEKVLSNILISPEAYYGYNAINHPMDIVVRPQKALRQ